MGDTMNRSLLAVLFLFMSVTPAQSAEQKAEVPKQAPAQKAAPVESEKSKDWKGLQAQEQWVARLQKQVSGETKQLGEMRAKLAAKYKLDVKGLEAGDYDYDTEKDVFLERTTR